MRKALIPMLASLALCGGATAALIATTARAQTSPRKPMMVALMSPGTMMAQNTPPAPGGRDMRDMHVPSPAEMAAHMKQMCDDHYAREVGRMAYLETRLNLTPSEQPLFARSWWIGFALMFFIPIITWFPLTLIGNVAAKASTIFPQQVGNCVLLHVMANALLSLILFSIWHFASNRKKGGQFDNILRSQNSGGMDWKKIGLSVWFAFLVIAIVDRWWSLHRTFSTLISGSGS